MADGKIIEVELKSDTLRIVKNDGSIRRLSVALKALRETILALSPKKILILSDWIVKWATLLRNEKNYKPKKFLCYKQREIVLVDFGFNIDGEFGGRHYAVVLEKNNNPNSHIITVAPITSYEPEKEKPHPTNVDLGIGAIHNSTKGAAIVVNQIRAISKMRIERPISSKDKKIYLDASKFAELLNKLQDKISDLTINKI